ncbi:hypothetical protein NC652_004547 [Populus alba x Populus x berolinensis]|nr:hypothetical protein NC652_004547 [Populus alba x Populus x berolinensis]
MKRSSLEPSFTISETADETDSNAASVVPSIYVGQFAQLLVLEYTRYAFTEGKRFQDSFEIIAFLKKAYESLSNLKARRMACFCGSHMAREYFVVGDLRNAKQLLDGVALLHRQEGRVTLLWEFLGYLRECSRKCGTVKEFVECSLESAALPVPSDSGIQYLQREIIHKEVFELGSGETRLASVEGNTDLKVNEENPLRLNKVGSWSAFMLVGLKA